MSDATTETTPLTKSTSEDATADASATSAARKSGRRKQLTAAERRAAILQKSDKRMALLFGTADKSELTKVEPPHAVTAPTPTDASATSLRNETTSGSPLSPNPESDPDAAAFRAVLRALSGDSTTVPASTPTSATDKSTTPKATTPKTPDTSGTLQRRNTPHAIAQAPPAVPAPQPKALEVDDLRKHMNVVKLEALQRTVCTVLAIVIAALFGITTDAASFFFPAFFTMEALVIGVFYLWRRSYHVKSAPRTVRRRRPAVVDGDPVEHVDDRPVDIGVMFDSFVEDLGYSDTVDRALSLLFVVSQMVDDFMLYVCAFGVSVSVAMLIHNAA